MQLEVTRAKAFAGFTWVKQAWKIFTLKPAVFMAMSAIIIVISILPAFIPYANFVVLFLMPFISLGFYQVTSNVEHNEPTDVPDIFQYLGQIPKYAVLLRIAAVTLILSIPITMVASDMQLLFAEQKLPSFSDVLLLAILFFVNAMITAFAAPTAWVAPETPLSIILKNSFKACWINAMPLTVFGLIVLLIVMVSMPLIIFGWLIAYAITTVAFLQAFLDIYQPVKPATDDAFVESTVSSNRDSDIEQ